MTHLSAQSEIPIPANPQFVTLVPCGSMEDFPAFLEDADARSLLAAWTAPWHPALLARSVRMPTWHRADSVPSILADQWFFASTAIEKKLPASFASSTAAIETCKVIRGATRKQFIDNLRDSVDSLDLDEISDGDRIVCVDDFYALAFAWLQIQVMTRRLRYTNNIDEIYFGGRVIEAAEQFVARDAAATITAMHDAFDALAQERDHYFSNDPHLVDLTLLAESTLGPSLQSALDRVRRPHEPPINFLIDASLAKVIAGSDQRAVTTLRTCIDEELVSVAGGGILIEGSVHHQSAASVREAILVAKRQTDEAIGHRCEVYARANGPSPGDLAPAVAAAGYIGAIPIDFAAGEGHGNESKLTWRTTTPSIDVLVSKPIDGSRSDSFLSLATRLGQAIDGGEVATALFVHWPGTESDAYRDLQRAASWGLALGRFWKIDEYFRDGQQPYHHHRGRADDGSAQWLTQSVEQPLSTAASIYTSTINAESARANTTLADLVKPAATDAPAKNINGTALTFAKQLVGNATLPSVAPESSSRLIVNPHSSAMRVSFSMPSPPTMTDAVFGASRGSDGRFEVTVDVPGHGFLVVKPSKTPPKRNWFSPRKKIASGTSLANEFLQVELSPASGGVKGVYSGSARGNRYSLRLVYVNDDASENEQVADMVCRSMRVVRADELRGSIETDGVLKNAAGKAIADFTIRYSLDRGSRWLWADATVNPTVAAVLGDNPWRSYFAFRSAIASDAATLFAPLRDKLHRVDGKRMDCPAGLLIDEVTKQTLLFADGRPAHRKTTDRFLDSLCIVRGEKSQTFRFAVGFDVPSPIDSLRGMISPPPVVACDAEATTPTSGWLLSCSTTDVVITDLRTESRSPLVISFLAIASRSESRKAKISFCRSVVSATCDGESIEPNDDRIEVPLVSHEVARVRVELKS